MSGAFFGTNRRSRGQPQKWLPRARVGHAGGHDRARHAQAARRELRPRAVAAAPPAGGAGARLRDHRLLPGRRLHHPRREARAAARHRAMSKSQVSRLAKSLDAIVEDFRTRPLEGAPFPHLTLDALVVKCREGGRTVNACVVYAVAVNRDGFRESLGRARRRHERGRCCPARLPQEPGRPRPRRRPPDHERCPPGLVDAIAAGPPRERAGNAAARTSCATC